MDSTVDVDENTKVPKRSTKQRLKIGLTIILLGIVGYVTYALFTGDTPKPQLIHTESTPKLEILQIAPAEVTISAQAFTPQTVKVKKGQAVSWTNKDRTQHQLISENYSAKDKTGFTGQGPLKFGEEFLFTFFQAGTYTYSDKLNPTGPKGIVIVE